MPARHLFISGPVSVTINDRRKWLISREWWSNISMLSARPSGIFYKPAKRFDPTLKDCVPFDLNRIDIQLASACNSLQKKLWMKQDHSLNEAKSFSVSNSGKDLNTSDEIFWHCVKWEKYHTTTGPSSISHAYNKWIHSGYMKIK